MPQLDKLTYFSQFFWLCLLLFTFYILLFNNNNGILGISRILKLRNQLLSHRGGEIRSKDPKNLEDISRKGFSTGLSYMYSSLSEVSQWCKTVDYLGNKISSSIFLYYLRGVLCPICLLFFKFLISFAFTCALIYVFKGGGFVAMAATNGASSSFLESSGEIDALLQTTTTTRTPENADYEDDNTSVNQEFLEDGQRARQAKLRELERLILQQYKDFIRQKYPWIPKGDILLPSMKGGVVEDVMEKLELETYSSSDLTDWINHLRANPKTLNFIFKDFVA
nr:hypothetical protein [Triticum aestivum]